MSARGESWGRFATKTAVTGAVVLAAAFVGNRIANAGPGDPVRKALTVSGRLSGVSGTVTATFRFYRAMGDATALCAPEVTIRDGMEREAGSGAFSVEVPLDQAGHVCPDTLFHDPSALVEVAIGETPVVTRRPINPVPYAVYAQQYGTPECPAGYQRLAEPPYVVCARPIAGRRSSGSTDLIADIVIRVGSGSSAFWIDRYESSIWTSIGAPVGEVRQIPDLRSFAQFPANGQWRTDPSSNAPAYALSVVNVPANAWATWFQAAEACRAAGKHLATGEQWLAAAQGTPDDGASDGIGGRCLTTGGAYRLTGHGRDRCRSAWGSQDMIGNLWEWTSDWMASPGSGSDFPNADAFGASYNSDGTGNLVSGAFDAPGGSTRRNLPGAVIRGGGAWEGVRSGIYAMATGYSPTYAGSDVGFRCVIPR